MDQTKAGKKMAAPVVFIASSSEALNVVNTVQKLLNRALGPTTEVRPWPSTFQLTMAYVESLERLLDWSDFAILVLTPDDKTRSRDNERLSPRDNVVFELGLFFGRLGRRRCFLVEQREADLKLPSDLLGIETAAFSISAGQDLEMSLSAPCARIASAISEAIKDLPGIERLAEKERLVREANRKFAERIMGTWWERIKAPGQAPALSFFPIEPDRVHNAVRLKGKAYNADGVHVATWKSAAARLESDKVVYVRECQRLDANTTAWLPGLAEVIFTESSDLVDQGGGKFWETDESHPENTVVKFVDLLRSLDESESSIMNRPGEKHKRALVRKKLDEW